ncbi:MAG: hypothetical protein CL792_02930 [Chloroflexi bacterium]|nr:hypothetical protein [Chloroflexota bacterium]
MEDSAYLTSIIIHMHIFLSLDSTARFLIATYTPLTIIKAPNTSKNVGISSSKTTASKDAPIGSQTIAIPTIAAGNTPNVQLIVV